MSKIVKAAILDMDGVLTITATIHAKAWKKLFDAFLEHRRANHGQETDPFDIETDYPEHIDGIPRKDGIERFLKSRGISVPYGEENDLPGFDTVSALGNLKNNFFHKQLEEESVEVFKENIEAIKEWKAGGMPLAVISSSKNCEKVLKKADLLDLFDVRVDGVISLEKNLKGKPAPDIFLEAARQLGVDKKHALVVEDAQMGVEAAKKGGFGWVVGFSPEGSQTLKEHGADEVVDSLKALDLKPNADPKSLPSAIEVFEEILNRLNGKKAVFFFDYDGTLTPIVEDHTEAFLSDSMREKLSAVAEHTVAGIVSGRGLDDVRERIGAIDGFYYVGSHGFEIAGPNDFYDQHDQAANQLSSLDNAQADLNETFSGDNSIEVERKKFAIAVHYRNAPESAFPEIEKKVEELSNLYSLQIGTGKKILELKPDVDWNKGRAIEWLMKELKVDHGDHLPVYIGDDITDEDAFEAIYEKGIGILVGSHGETSHARYRLKNVEEVGLFLDKIIEQLKVATYE